MTIYSTDMLTLLDNTEAIVETETIPAGTLPSIYNTYVGPKRNPPKYPFISIIPLTEFPASVNNGEIHNVRRVRIEAYSKSADSRAAMRASIGITEQIKNLFEVNAPNWQIPDKDTGDPTVFDNVIGEIVPSDTSIPYRNEFIQMSSLDLECHSKDPFHAGVDGTSSATFSQVDTKTLIDTITAVYKTYRTGAEDILSDIKGFRSFVLKPQMKFPLIFFGIEVHNRDHAFAGRDLVNREVSIYVLHKTGNYTTSLRRNLEIVELCRKIWFANKDFGGKVFNFTYSGITYGQITTDNELLFGSTLRFMTQTVDNLSG